MTPSVNNNSTSGTGSSSATSSSSNGSTNEQMFLQLLIAQLENQDPMNPTDGTAFVTELAQFQTLSTDMGMSQDVSSILTDVNQLVPSPSTTSTSQS